MKGNLYISASGCDDAACVIAAPIAAALMLPAGSFIVSGSIVVVGNTVHWIEAQGKCKDSETNKAVTTLVESTKSAGGKVLKTSEEAINWLKGIVEKGEKIFDNT